MRIFAKVFKHKSSVMKKLIFAIALVSVAASCNKPAENQSASEISETAPLPNEATDVNSNLDASGNDRQTEGVDVNATNSGGIPNDSTVAAPVQPVDNTGVSR